MLRGAGSPRRGCGVRPRPGTFAAGWRRGSPARHGRNNVGRNVRHGRRRGRGADRGRVEAGGLPQLVHHGPVPHHARGLIAPSPVQKATAPRQRAVRFLTPAIFFREPLRGAAASSPAGSTSWRNPRPYRSRPVRYRARALAAGAPSGPHLVCDQGSASGRRHATTSTPSSAKRRGAHRGGRLALPAAPPGHAAESGLVAGPPEQGVGVGRESAPRISQMRRSSAARSRWIRKSRPQRGGDRAGAEWRRDG